jgi:hypothetical protein
MSTLRALTPRTISSNLNGTPIQLLLTARFLHNHYTRAPRSHLSPPSISGLRSIRPSTLRYLTSQLRSPYSSCSAPLRDEPSHSYPSATPNHPSVYAFFEHATSTWQYVVADPTTSDAVIIDPVLDYDAASGNISTNSAETLLDFIQRKRLKVKRIL